MHGSENPGEANREIEFILIQNLKIAEETFVVNV